MALPVTLNVESSPRDYVTFEFPLLSFTSLGLGLAWPYVRRRLSCTTSFPHFIVPMFSISAFPQYLIFKQV